MRGCLSTGATLIAIAFVAAAVWFGASALLAGSPDALGTALGWLAPEGAAGPSPAGTAGPRAAGPSPRPATTPTPAPGETVLTRLSEADLTAALRQALAREQEGIRIDNPRARVLPSQIEVTGTVRGVLPLPVEVVAAGRPEVRDGRPFIVVERAEGGGIPLPDTVHRRLEAAINSIDVVRVPADVTVTRIGLERGQVVVYGRRR